MIIHAVKYLPRCHEHESEGRHNNGYGCPEEYTERQKKIINGEHVDHLRRNDITKLMEKALSHDDDKTARAVSDMYDDFMNPKSERMYTKEEAIAILDELDRNTIIIKR